MLQYLVYVTNRNAQQGNHNTTHHHSIPNRSKKLSCSHSQRISIVLSMVPKMKDSDKQYIKHNPQETCNLYVFLYPFSEWCWRKTTRPCGYNIHKYLMCYESVMDVILGTTRLTPILQSYSVNTKNWFCWLIIQIQILILLWVHTIGHSLISCSHVSVIDHNHIYTWSFPLAPGCI